MISSTNFVQWNVLPQDTRIFIIHILLNFEILFLEAYRFQNLEGLEGLKEYPPPPPPP